MHTRSPTCAPESSQAVPRLLELRAFIAEQAPAPDDAEIEAETLLRVPER